MFDLSKRDSDIIKGIAIILMFIHHFFCFPTWYADDISYPQLAEFAEFYRFPTKICVALFAFLSGYAYGKRIEREGNKDFRYSVKKITDLYIGYWCVFVPLFILAAIIENEPVTFKNLFMQLIGVSSKTMLFAWYVPFFAITMIVLPIITAYGNGSRSIFVILAFVIIKFFSSIIVWSVDIQWIKNVCSDFQGTFPTVAMGYYFSRWKIFNKLQSGFDPDKKIISIITWIVIILLSFYGKAYSRSFKIGEMYFKGEVMEMAYSMDIFYAPLAIWAIVNLIHIWNPGELILKILEKMGKKSMMMWFISCVFFSNLYQIFQPFLYWPRYPVLVILWGCMLCYGLAYILNYCCNKICIIKDNLLDNLGLSSK